eukprot:3023911-Amphidinium_carterae.1
MIPKFQPPNGIWDTGYFWGSVLRKLTHVSQRCPRSARGCSIAESSYQQVALYVRLGWVAKSTQFSASLIGFAEVISEVQKKTETRQQVLWGMIARVV